MKYLFPQFALTLLAGCLLAGTANADIIVTRDSDPATSIQKLGDTFNSTWAVSWTQNFSSTSTNIHAFNLSNPSTDHSVTVNFDLGTTVGANDVGSTSFVLGLNADVADALLFSGLTLGPGEYFLNASVSGSATAAYSAIWHGGAGAGYAAPGATLGYDYANLDSTLPVVGFQVDGTLSKVPEPASMLLIGLGLLGLTVARKWRPNNLICRIRK